MRDEDPTQAETAFFELLKRRIEGVQDWYHRDADGLWMIASLDLPLGGPIEHTWRCDFDGKFLLAGRSAGFLNWDDGVRARAAEINVDGALGLNASVTDPVSAAEVAAEWFAARIADLGGGPDIH